MTSKGREVGGEVGVTSLHVNSIPFSVSVTQIRNRKKETKGQERRKEKGELPVLKGAWITENDV